MRRSLLLVLAVLAALAIGPSLAQAQSSAEASSRDPERASSLSKRALDLLQKGEDSNDPNEKLAVYTEGERLAREAVALDPSNADAHFALFANHGRRLLAEGVTVNPFKLLEVNRELDQCLDLDPDHSDALAARGGLYRQLPSLLGGSLSKAEEYLSRSIELDPRSTGARIELARTYIDMGKPSRALPLLEQAALWADRLNKPRQLGEARQLLSELQAP